jgi:deoxyadenosine/deoxycytidine kinase
LNTCNAQKTVYLKTDFNICYERINKRNREGESNISIEYLEKCHEYHEYMINKISNKILIIDSNIDTDLNKDIINIWIEKIKNFIYE